MPDHREDAFSKPIPASVIVLGLFCGLVIALILGSVITGINPELDEGKARYDIVSILLFWIGGSIVSLGVLLPIHARITRRQERDR